jgi:hypothetical protein
LIGWIAQGHDPDDVNLLPQRIEAVGKADVDRILNLIAGPGSVAEGVLGPKTGE